MPTTDVDLYRLTQTDYDKFLNAIQRPPDAAGWWVSSGTPVGGVLGDHPAQEVTIVAFTGNIDAHRAELRSLWGGPVCVVQQALEGRARGGGTLAQRTW